MTGRVVGPVTTATTAGAAAGTVLVWAVEAITARDIPDPVELAVAVLLGLLGGFLVPPKGSGDNAGG